MSDSNDKKWFETLRVNSWEIEILIVACILAALFSISDIFEVKMAALQVSSHWDMRGYTTNSVPFWMIIGGVKAFLYFAMQLCFIVAKFTFSSYIFFRGFWVAIIGLSSVFPKGINVKSLKSSSYFSKLIPENNFNTYILRLDNICSSVFSFGFLTAFYCVSILLYFSLVVLLVGSIEYIALYFFKNLSSPFYYSLFGIFFLFGTIFFLDILFLGILKRVKWKVFSYPYSKLYSLLRIITCFFLYESIYYLLISNVKRRVIVIFWAFLILIISVAFLSYKANGYLNFPSDDSPAKSFMSQSFYEDRLLSSGNNFSSNDSPFINSEIISKSYLKLHIPFHPYLHTSIDSACGITSKILASDQNIADEILLDCINDIYAIYIDNDTIDNDFVFYRYSSGDVSIKTFFMPISVNKYKEGRHIITVEKLFSEWYSDGVYSEDEEDWVYESDEHMLSKSPDSLIHIPFYIYR